MTGPIVMSHPVSTDRYRPDSLPAGVNIGHTPMRRFPQPACSCSDCVSRECCPGAQLTALTEHQAAPLVRHNHTLGYREHLFHAGEKPEALFVVKSGTVKLYLMSEDGSEQVVAFYMPGEVLGLDALGTGIHRSSAVVLERASFCVIPLASLERSPGCHRLLFKLLSLELVRDHHTIELITKKDAEAKMAHFLIGLVGTFPGPRFFRHQFQPEHETQRDRQPPGPGGGNRQPHPDPLPGGRAYRRQTPPGADSQLGRTGKAGRLSRLPRRGNRLPARKPRILAIRPIHRRLERKDRLA